MRSGFTRKVLAALALVAPMMLAIPAPAANAASTEAAVMVEGSGTITPALPCTGCAINFDFTAVVAGTGAETGIYTGCQFNGNSAGLEDELGGAGSGNLTGCAASGTVTYKRTGVLVQVSGKVTINGVCFDIVASALVFIPISTPVTTFIVTGYVYLHASGCV